MSIPVIARSEATTRLRLLRKLRRAWRPPKRLGAKAEATPLSYRAKEAGLLRFTRNDGVASARLCRQHVIVDLADLVYPAQPHRRGELFCQEVNRLGDTGLAGGTQPVRVGAADHAALRP